MTQEYTKYRFYQPVERSLPENGKGWGLVLDGITHECTRSFEDSGDVSVVSYANISGKTLYKETFDRIQNLVVSTSYNGDYSVEKTVMQDADDGTILDIKYKRITDQAGLSNDQAAQSDANVAEKIIYHESIRTNHTDDVADDETVKTYYAARIDVLYNVVY